MSSMRSVRSRRIASTWAQRASRSAWLALSACACLRSVAVHAQGQALPNDTTSPASPSAWPSELRVVVERCATLPFDADAFTRALEVELAALGIRASVDASADQRPLAEALLDARDALHVRAPACGDALEIELVHAGEHARTALSARELGELGRERALALSTIEHARASWARASVNARAATVATAAASVEATVAAPPVESTAAQTAPASTVASQDRERPPALQRAAAQRAWPARERVFVAGAGAWRIDSAWMPSLTAQVAFPFAAHYALRAGVAFASVAQQRAGDVVRTNVYALAASADVRVFGASSWELAIGPSLQLALADARIQESDAGVRGRTLAPLLTGGLRVGWLARLGGGAQLAFGLDAGYALIGARLVMRDARSVDLTGPSWGAALGVGTAF